MLPEFLLKLINGVPELIVALSLIISGAAVIATFTPTPKDDAFFAKLKGLLDMVGMNFGKAKNATSVKPPPKT